MEEKVNIPNKRNCLYSLWPFGPLPRDFNESKIFEYLDSYRRSNDCSDAVKEAINIVEAFGKEHFDEFKYIDSTTLSHKIGMSDASELKTMLQRYLFYVLTLLLLISSKLYHLNAFYISWGTSFNSFHFATFDVASNEREYLKFYEQGLKNAFTDSKAEPVNMEEYLRDDSNFPTASSTNSKSLFHMVNSSKRNHGEWYSVKKKLADGTYKLNIHESLEVPSFYRFTLTKSRTKLNYLQKIEAIAMESPEILYQRSGGSPCDWMKATVEECKTSLGRMKAKDPSTLVPFNKYGDSVLSQVRTLRLQ